MSELSYSLNASNQQNVEIRTSTDVFEALQRKYKQIRAEAKRLSLKKNFRHEPEQLNNKRAAYYKSKDNRAYLRRRESLILSVNEERRKFLFKALYSDSRSE